MTSQRGECWKRSLHADIVDYQSSFGKRTRKDPMCETEESGRGENKGEQRLVDLNRGGLFLQRPPDPRQTWGK